MQILASGSFLDHSVTLSDLATVAIAIATIVTLIMNIYQTKRSDRRTVSQVNRQDRIRIYAISLAGLRATLSDLEENVRSVEVRSRTRYTGNATTGTNGIVELELDTSKSSIRHEVINEVGSFEHQTQMELLASSEMFYAVQNWLIQFHEMKTGFDSALGTIGKGLKSGVLDEVSGNRALEEAQQVVNDKWLKLNVELGRLQKAMKRELDVTH